MFTKILIANRGEIACRIITTAKKLGIKTVAIYSDADANAKHTQLADEAYHIGPAPVADSYLQGDTIIDTALKSGAQAIHPGYGFLSENVNFVDRVTQAGLIFIGPSAQAMATMGLKNTAKALMAESGVPIVPGYHGNNQNADFLAEQAHTIGYPILIKARAGGGGKGMRLVHDPNEFQWALESAQREALSSFGDAHCLIEKYITHPRHIEIQVFGDSHGNIVHFFERDCSLQRRYQKVIEEAPAPNMPHEVRTAMGTAAINAARAIGYVGAGTVEFIVDASNPLRTDGFWFMEMNTRLQVEHPVSELITGYDFVELQLRVAAGEPLPCSQDDLTIDGWAFEARLYAEDVPKGFLPATGTLQYLSYPEQHTAFTNSAIRIDSGVAQGDNISPWYDPMIAKVIAHGPNRETALNRLRQTLANCHVLGCTTNIDFLHTLTTHNGFQQGAVDTGLIKRDMEQLITQLPPCSMTIAIASVAGLGLLTHAPDNNDPWSTLTGWRAWGHAQHSITLSMGNNHYNRTITLLGKNTYEVQGKDKSLQFKILSTFDNTVQVSFDQKIFWVKVVHNTDKVAVFKEGKTHEFTLPTTLGVHNQPVDTGDNILSPMPGLIRLVHVSPEDTVAKNTPLLVLEAMKMEHTLYAPRDGKVAEILVNQGDQVGNGVTLIRLAPNHD